MLLLSCLLWFMLLWIKFFFTNLLSKVLAVLCQALNYTKIISNIDICQAWLFCLNYQDFYQLTSILANTNNILRSDLCYLANILININDILKIDFYHLVGTLANTNNKTDYFMRGRLVTSNQLLTLQHKLNLTQKK